MDEQSSNVVEHACHKKAFDVGFPSIARKDSGRDSATDAVVPEGLHIEQIFGHLGEHFHDRSCQGYIPQLLCAHNRDGTGDGFDL